MNKEIMKKMGYGGEVEAGFCPLCKHAVDPSLMDWLSFKEYKISGLCQKCQDKTFVEEE